MHIIHCTCIYETDLQNIDLHSALATGKSRPAEPTHIQQSTMAIKRHFVGRPADVSSDSESDSGSGSGSDSEREEEEKDVEQPLQNYDTSRQAGAASADPPVNAAAAAAASSAAPKPASRSATASSSSSIPKGQSNYKIIDQIITEQRGHRKPVIGYETIERAESSESETESSEESSDEEAAAPKKLVRPKFIPKSQREGNKAISEPVEDLTSELQSQSTLKFIENRIRAEQEAQRALYEEENMAEFGGVDDTDDLDVEKELEDWKEREKARLERDREELIAREEALDAREREAQGESVIAESEGQQGQNHWEQGRDKGGKAKGAFYQEQDILQRDMSGPMEDDYTDKKSIPAHLLGRNVGQKGRITHKSLKDQDTTRKRQR